MLNFQDDAAAFRAFIREHQHSVFNIVLKMVAQPHDAEEITQDVFIDVYRKPGVFRGDSSVSTWLYRIAMNKCIDHLRKKERGKKWSITGFFNTKTNDEQEPAEFFHPGIAVENREKAAVLFKAMKKLPPSQHKAWVLSELENLSYREIADVMNISLSSVESLLFRARQNLRKIISTMYPNEK
jgi:RNA polymerase sigma factor (sigma-70 family)